MFDIFENCGTVTKAVRRRAVERTGLKWSKIYKWIFDQGSRLSVYSRPGDDAEQALLNMDDREFRNTVFFEVSRVCPATRS